jgi:hypothetical protein
MSISERTSVDGIALHACLDLLLEAEFIRYGKLARDVLDEPRDRGQTLGLHYARED